MRALWLAAGLTFTLLGLIGALVPLLPTTIFLIVAAYCFGRSSRRLEAWLLGHPRFGPTLVAWREEGAIGRRAKIAACSGMALGFGLFWWTAHPTTPVAIGAAVALVGCAAFVVSRPAPRGR